MTFLQEPVRLPFFILLYETVDLAVNGTVNVEETDSIVVTCAVIVQVMNALTKILLMKMRERQMHKSSK